MTRISVTTNQRLTQGCWEGFTGHPRFVCLYLHRIVQPFARLHPVIGMRFSG
jgi:hypothetical protein